MPNISPINIETQKLNNSGVSTNPEFVKEKCRSANSVLLSKNKINRIMQEKRIIDELNNPGIPDIGFIFSPENIDIIPGLLNKLLNEVKKQYKILINKPKESVNYDELYSRESKESFELYLLLSFLFHFKSVNDLPELRKIIEDFRLKIVHQSNEELYSVKLYELSKYILNNTDLNDDQKIILKRDIKNFELRGIHLPKKKVKRIKEINKIFGDLSLKFSNNLLDEEKSFEYVFENTDSIKEMPEDILNRAKLKAKEKGKEGYLFNLNQQDVGSIFLYCSDSNIRKYFHYSIKKLATNGKYDNNEICFDTLRLREEKTKILAYDNFFQMTAENLMASNDSEVKKILIEIQKKAKEKGLKEMEMLKEYFKLKELNVWDIAYYIRLYKEKELNLNIDIVREYFEFDMVLNGLKEIANKFYGVDLKEIEGIKYNADLRYFEVYKGKELLGYYLLDPFSSPNKKSGAWNNSLRSKKSINGKKTYPLLVTVLNNNKGEKGKTLIGQQRAITLFHEFGHAIHTLLGKSEYANLNGTASMERDFVELPSTFMENYSKEKESLKYFAKHFETGEVISDEILNKIQKTENIFSGVNMFSVLDRSFIDIILHSEEVPKNPEELNKKVHAIQKKYSLFNFSEETSKAHCSISHIFAGSYAANFYSYIRADIMDAQIFAQFEEKGIFDKALSEKYVDKILSQGSRKPAKELFKDFIGSDIIDPTYYMKKKGFL